MKLTIQMKLTIWMKLTIQTKFVKLVGKKIEMIEWKNFDNNVCVNLNFINRK
jgi:hypothetical protein